MPTALLAGLEVSPPPVGLGTDDTRLRDWALFHAARAGDRVRLAVQSQGPGKWRDDTVTYRVKARGRDGSLVVTDLAGAPAGRLVLRTSSSAGYFDTHPTHYLPGLDKDLGLLGPGPGQVRGAELTRLEAAKPRKSLYPFRDYGLDRAYSAAQAILSVRRLEDRLPEVAGLDYAGHNAYTFDGGTFHLERRPSLTWGSLDLRGGPLRSQKQARDAFKAVYPEDRQVSILEGRNETDWTIHVGALEPPTDGPHNPWALNYGLWRTVGMAIPARLWHRTKPGGEYYDMIPHKGLPPLGRPPKIRGVGPIVFFRHWPDAGGKGPGNVGVLEVSPKGRAWELAFRHGLHGDTGPAPSGFAPNAGPKLVIGTYKTANEAKRAGLAWLEADPNPLYEAARQEGLRKANPTGKLTKKERELLELMRKAGPQGVMAVDQWWRVARRLQQRGKAVLEDELVGEGIPKSARNKRPGFRAFAPGLELLPLTYAARDRWKDHSRKTAPWPPPPRTFA